MNITNEQTTKSPKEHTNEHNHEQYPSYPTNFINAFSQKDSIFTHYATFIQLKKKKKKKVGNAE